MVGAACRPRQIKKKEWNTVGLLPGAKGTISREPGRQGRSNMPENFTQGGGARGLCFHGKHSPKSTTAAAGASSILARVHDDLAWKHIAEHADEDGRRLSWSTTIGSAEAERLTQAISAQDVRADPRGGIWEDYAIIFEYLATYRANCQPHLIPDDSVRHNSEADLDAWRDHDCSTAVRGYRLVIEDGSDVSHSSDDWNEPDEELGGHAHLGCSEAFV
jgi:hypothetical protein